MSVKGGEDLVRRHSLDLPPHSSDRGSLYVVCVLADVIFCLLTGGSRLKRIARSFEQDLLFDEDGQG